jgi:hypothetical protein
MNFTLIWVYKIKKKFQSKRLYNPQGNRLNTLISENGLNIRNTGGITYVFAIEGFPTSAGPHRNGNFPGTIVYYFELTQTTPIHIDLDDVE